MSRNRDLPLTGTALLLLVVLLITPGMVMAGQITSNQAILAEIIPNIVQLMRNNGYVMPEYRVIEGRTDVSISGPPERHAFFGYVDKGWLNKDQKIVLYFYEADQLPIAGRRQVIDYLLKVFEEKSGAFSLSLYMTRARYKKPQLTMPDAFLEIHLNQTAR